MASVSQGPSRPPSRRPAEPNPPPPSNIHRPPSLRSPKPHPSHPAHPTNPSISAAPTSAAWHQSAPILPPHHAPLSPQQMPSHGPAPAQLRNIPKPSSQRAHGTRHPSKQQPTSAPAAFHASRPPASSQNEAPLPIPQHVDRQHPGHHHSHPIDTAHPLQHGHQQLQPTAHNPQNPVQLIHASSRPETAYLHQQQQHVQSYRNIPRQDLRQHLIQQPMPQNVSRQTQNETAQRRPDSPQMGPHRLAPQQLMSQHPTINSSHAQSQGQRKQSQVQNSAEMQQLHHESLQMTQHPPRRTYRAAQTQDPPNRFHRSRSNMNGTRPSYPPRQAADQVQHMTQKQSAHHQRTQDIQLVPQGQQGRQTPQNQQAGSYPAGHPVIANSTSTLTAAHNTAKPIASEANAPNGQIYQVQMAIPQGAIAVSGAPNVHYPGPPYQYATLFDPLSMNPSMPPAALAQAAVGQDMTILRSRDRQGQEAPVQHVQGRAGMQGNDRGGVVAQDMHGLVEHGQQQVVHRASAQGSGEHVLQGRGAAPGAAQHAIRTSIYPPMDHQHAAAQQVVITQPPTIQQHTGQIIMHNQGGQVAQHAPMQAQDSNFEQRMYQVGNPNQIAPTVVVTPQQDRDQQQSTTVNAPNQQRLQPWGTANPNVRVVAGGITQQPNGEMPNVLTAQGTIITQPQLFNMNAQNGTAQQVAQQVAIHKAQRQSQQLLPNMRRMSQTSAEASPRKRRQLNPAGTTVINGVVATRTFSCSGCAQEFSRKRDRDNHVRTVHERSFACSKCQARFKTKSDANRHIRIVHERIRPYQCPSCPSMFSERNKLRRHRETVHEKLRPYVCPVCSARFGELGNLRQHTGSLHPDYQVEPSQARSRVNSQVQS